VVVVVEVQASVEIATSIQLSRDGSEALQSLLEAGQGSGQPRGGT
jgi:hypothetical protein